MVPIARIGRTQLEMSWYSLALLSAAMMLAASPPAHADTATERAPTVLKYNDGKADGKKSIGGSGEMIRFELPEGVTKVRGIRIHGSRYGLPQAPE